MLAVEGRVGPRRSGTRTRAVETVLWDYFTQGSFLRPDGFYAKIRESGRREGTPSRLIFTRNELPTYPPCETVEIQLHASVVSAPPSWKTSIPPPMIGCQSSRSRH
jgi:hypothetical protein